MTSASGSKTFVRRVVALFSVGMIGQLVGIVAGVAQARELGPEGKSVLAYAVIALSTVAMGMSGFSDAVLMQAGRDRRALGRISAAMLGIVGVVGLPCAAVALVVGLVVPSQWPLIGAALAMPFALYAQGARGVLLATGATAAVAWQGSVTSIFLNGAIIAALVFAHIDSGQLLMLWFAGQVAAAAYTAFALKRAVGPRPATLAGVPSINVLMREQAEFGLRTSLATVAGYINLRIDIFLISALLGARMLGIYSLAIGAGELLWNVSLPIVYAALESISGDPFHVAASMTARLMRIVVALQLALGTALFIVGPWLIVTVYGQAFAEAGPVLRILLPGLTVYAVEAFLGYFILVQVRRPLLLFTVQLISAALCTIITLVALPRYGIASAAFATTITYIGVVVFKSLFFKKMTGIGMREQWILRPDDLRPFIAKLKKLTGAKTPLEPEYRQHDDIAIGEHPVALAKSP